MNRFSCISLFLTMTGLLLCMLLLTPKTVSAQTWSAQNGGVPYHWTGVKFVNSTHGWVCSTSGHVRRTTNGGTSWFGHSYQELVVAFDIEFVDVNNGWVVGALWPIMHTTTGGNLWTHQNAGIDMYTNLRGVCFVDLNYGWAVGESGILLHTTNGGATWVLQTSGTSQFLTDVDFVDANNGWAVGDAHTVVHTTNGGGIWNTQTVPITQGFNGVCFVDAQQGWAVGWSGKIVHTTNGGNTWTLQTSGTTQALEGVSFVDAQHGWVCGSGGTILRTTNGGSTWSPQVSGTGLELYDVCMLDMYSGWISGENGTILHYSDTGDDPLPLDVQIGEHFCLNFDTRHVRTIRWCSPFNGDPIFSSVAGCNGQSDCSESCTPYGGTVTWTAQLDSVSSDTSSPCAFPNRWWSARFETQSEGCICVSFESQLPVELQSFELVPGDGIITLQWVTASESDNDHFEIVRDGSLIAQVASRGNGASGHAYAYADRIANDVTHTYALVAVDVSGTSTELASGTGTASSGLAPLVTAYTLDQNYPNPFNPTTTIAFNLVASGHVSIRMYNVMGREVSTIVDGELPAGRHAAVLNAEPLPSGIYLCRMEVNGFNAEIKLLLMK